MKIKHMSLRYKLILTYMASVFLAVGCILIAILFFFIVEYKNYAIVTGFISRHILIFLFISFILFLVLMNGFYLLLTRNGMKDINIIMENLEFISKGNLNIHIPMTRRDELGQLADSINSMASKLKKLMEEEREWERVKNDLITNVSHDLRTPLTSILGYVELISEGQYTNKENLKHYADIALIKGNELKVLIDDLFEYSKLNSPEMKLNKKHINLVELLEQVTIGFMPQLKETGMDYRLSLGGEKVYLDADPVLLVRMFNNLIGNALNYGKDGKYVDIHLKQEVHRVVVEIINYGNAIAQEDLPNIFEKFYRGDKSRSRQKGSSGLGLAIVKNIVDKHDGAIRVDSSDTCTVFQVTFQVKII